MLKQIYKGYCRVEEILVGTGFMIIVSLTLMNAILRVFKIPIISADDICTLLFGWVAFIGADVALRYSRLVGMDILTSKLHPKVQKVLQIAVYLIMIAALVLFSYHGFGLARSNWKRAFNSLKVSYGWVTLSLPVCSILMILTCVIKIGKVLLHFNDDTYNVKKDNPDLIGEEYTGIDQEPGNGPEAVQS